MVLQLCPLASSVSHIYQKFYPRPNIHVMFGSLPAVGSIRGWITFSLLINRRLSSLGTGPKPRCSECIRDYCHITEEGNTPGFDSNRLNTTEATKKIMVQLIIYKNVAAGPFWLIYPAKEIQVNIVVFKSDAERDSSHDFTNFVVDTWDMPKFFSVKVTIRSNCCSV